MDVPTLTGEQIEQAIVLFTPIVLKVIDQFRHRGGVLTGEEIEAAFRQHLADAKATGQAALDALAAEPDAPDTP